MRTIDTIVIHCSDTPAGREHTAADIRRWHTAKPPRGNGWADIGYHYVVRLDGTVEAGRPVERVGAHVAGHNARSIGVCYIGGRSATDGRAADTRTAAQRTALRQLVARLVAEHPGVKRVVGHRDLNAGKACPCFDARAEYNGMVQR